MVRRPIRAAVRRTRRAISPRFATSSESNTSSDTSAMGLAIVVLVAAIAVAAALGGRWDRLAHLQLRSRGLIVAAVVAQAGGGLIRLARVRGPRKAHRRRPGVRPARPVWVCAREPRPPRGPPGHRRLLAHPARVALNRG